MSDLRERVKEAAGVLAAHRKELVSVDEQYKKLLTTEAALVRVRSVLQRAAQLCQQSVEAHFSEIVTDALSTVFGEHAYKFSVAYAARNNATECDLTFIDDAGNQRDPLDSCGLGAADVASMALRIAYMELERTALFLLADEPGRQLDIVRSPYLADFLQSACNQLGIQMIVITHDVNNIAAAADKQFSVVMKDKANKISEVTEIVKK